MFALVVQSSIAEHPIQMTFSSHIYKKTIMIREHMWSYMLIKVEDE